MRADLRNWWLLRSLPFQAERLLLGELAIPWGLTVAIIWLALIAGSAQLDAARFALFLLIPPVCLILSLISAYDILRQSNAGMLLNGDVPGISWRALLGGMLCLAIPAGTIRLFQPFPWTGMLLAVVASVMLAHAAWHPAARKYRSGFVGRLSPLYGNKLQVRTGAAQTNMAIKKRLPAKALFY